MSRKLLGVGRHTNKNKTDTLNSSTSSGGSELWFKRIVQAKRTAFKSTTEDSREHLSICHTAGEIITSYSEGQLEFFFQPAPRRRPNHRCSDCVAKCTFTTPGKLASLS